MTELVLSKELEGLDKSKASQIEAVFSPMVEMLKSFEGAYDEVMSMDQSEEKSKKAKRLRLDISKVRIDADKVRKSQKEEYLRAGNAIQGVYNVLKFAVVDKEEKLKEIETYYERIEEERKAKVQAERELELSRYDIDGSTMNLSGMDDAVYENLVEGSKAKFEAIKEAERKAEEQRIESERKQNLFYDRKLELSRYQSVYDVSVLNLDTSEQEYVSMIESAKQEEKQKQEEQEKIRLENERLQKEREEREKQLEAERLKAEEERKKQEAIIQKEREEREAIELKSRTEKEESERKERERVQAEKEAQKKAALAPDKEKLMNFVSILMNGKDSVKSDEAKAALSKAVSILTDTANAM